MNEKNNINQPFRTKIFYKKGSSLSRELPASSEDRKHFFTLGICKLRII